MFNLREDLNIYFSQNYENWDRFKAMLREKSNSGTKSIDLPAKIKVYYLNRKPIHYTAEIEGIVFTPFIYKMWDTGLLGDVRVTSLNIPVEKMGRKYRKSSVKEKAHIVEVPKMVPIQIHSYHAFQILQTEKERLLPDVILNTLIHSPTNLLDDIIACMPPNSCFTYLMARLYGIDMSEHKCTQLPFDRSHWETRKLMRSLQKPNFGLKTVEEIKNLVFCISECNKFLSNAEEFKSIFFPSEYRRLDTAEDFDALMALFPTFVDRRKDVIDGSMLVF